MSKLDITELTAGKTLVVRQEGDDEREARLQRENNEHALRLEKERATFYTAGVLYVISLVGSFFFAVHGDNADQQKWAMSLVTLLAGGLIGFLTGKQTK